MKTTGVEIKKTKTNKDYKVFTLENGKKLSVFSFSPSYESLQVGSDIPDDELEYQQQYDNYKLKDTPRSAPRASTGPARAANITAESVKHAQENRNEAVKMAAAYRDATLLLIAQYPDGLPPEWQKEHQAIREWYIKDWSNRSGQPF